MRKFVLFAADTDRTTARNVDRIANTLLVLSEKHRKIRESFPGVGDAADRSDPDE